MSFFGNKRLIIVLVGLVILISVMGFTARERANLTWPEKLLKDTVSLVQGFFYRPAQAFSGFLEGVNDAYNVYEENRILKANLDQYAQVSAQLKQLEVENQNLRAALQTKNSLTDYQVRVAEVVSRNADQWNDVVIIDKGAKHGIKKDMAVYTATGLIGRVQSVANLSATVELLSSMERHNRVSAIILSKQIVNNQTTYRQINGIVEDYDPRDRLLIMRKIPLDQKFVPGEQVVTSGLGGVIPRGLLIGHVVRVEPGDYGLTQTAYLQPAADFTQINQVLVVERKYVTTPTGELVPSTELNEQGQLLPSGSTASTQSGSSNQTASALAGGGQ
ncbi:rod shape-determining protein MreC [Brevibacillus dissolubilis]|uniref:rod shape-determining protein MreC n=1 Tax=Brevibacillus dissolubilis TaxID=1844116 RepID=UPI001115BBE3|nr:rod shape-determining protein MreC [Brevibacillus dissolubilis]